MLTPPSLMRMAAFTRLGTGHTGKNLAQVTPENEKNVPRRPAEGEMGHLAHLDE